MAKRGVRVDGVWYSSMRKAAQASGIPYTTFLHRLDAGMSVDEAMQRELKSQKKIIIKNIEYSSMAKAAKAYNVPHNTFVARIKNGWTPEQAAGLQKRLVPFRPKRTSPIVLKGKEYPSVTQAAKEFGFTYSCVSKRMAKGLTPEQAFELEPFPEWFIPGKGQFATAKKMQRQKQETAANARKCARCKKELPLSEFSRYSVSDSHNYYHHCKNCQSDRFLRYRYNIGVKNYLEIAKQQNGNCAICGKGLELQQDTARRSKKVAVDHCHTSGKVRGLLCAPCNQGLGFFKDSIENLENAISYLKFHSQASIQ